MSRSTFTRRAGGDRRSRRRIANELRPTARVRSHCGLRPDAGAPRFRCDPRRRAASTGRASRNARTLSWSRARIRLAPPFRSSWIPAPPFA